MEKKLYFKLSDGVDASNIVMDLSGCMEWIKGDVDGVAEEDSEDYEYTLVPVWLTDEEFNNLPEASI